MDQKISMEVPLSKIVVSESNKMFRKNKSFNNPEFIASIREHGVITAITLRYIPDSDTYMLVAGERRYRAMLQINAEFPERNTIPALIQNWNEAEAFNAQMIENLHREDVSPLMEAQGYKKALQELPSDATLAEQYLELSKRFGKSETYIYRRLTLLNLIPEAAKQYDGGQLLLGHALILARLDPADQAQLLDECKDRQNGGYYSVKEFERIVRERVTRNLSNALFDTRAAGLIPNASPCVVCPKRSGASPLLFDDIKKKDVCFDSSCFQRKTHAWLYNTVKDAVENKPDIRFAIDPRQEDVISTVEELILSNSVSVLDSTRDFHSYDVYGTKVKMNVMFLNGNDAGKVIPVYSLRKKGQVESSDNGPSLKKTKTIERIERDDAIGRIRVRMKRAIQLDQQAIYARVLHALPKTKAFQFNSKVKEIPLDKLMMRYVLIESCGEALTSQISKHFKIPKVNGLSPVVAKKRLEAISRMTDSQFTCLVRMILLNKLSGQATFAMQEPGLLLKQAAYAFGEVPIQAFEKEQEDIAVKRTARFNERIKELRLKSKKK